MAEYYQMRLHHHVILCVIQSSRIIVIQQFIDLKILELHMREFILFSCDVHKDLFLSIDI